MGYTLTPERLFEYQQQIISCIEIDNNLYILTINGQLIELSSQGSTLVHDFGGQPLGITQDPVEKNLFIADQAIQSILVYQSGPENKVSLQSQGSHEELIREYEGMPLLGPNSMCLSQNNFCLYFTDSGPFCHSSLENKIGSVYMIDLSAMTMKPLLHGGLAMPSGICLSLDEKILYVSETCVNRVLRIVLTEDGGFHHNTFYQFAGRFGPSAITMSASGLLYVARFELKNMSDNGMISVINSSGQMIDNLNIKGCPEISSLTFSKLSSSTLFICDSSFAMYKVHINLEEKNEKDKN